MPIFLNAEVTVLTIFTNNMHAAVYNHRKNDAKIMPNY
jgi:hypothetical protein